MLIQQNLIIQHTTETGCGIHIKCSKTIRAILTQIFQRCMCRDVGLLAGYICRLAAAAVHSLQHRTSLWSNPKWKCACEPMLQSESGAGGCGIFTAWRCPGFPPPPCSEPLMVNVCMCARRAYYGAREYGRVLRHPTIKRNSTVHELHLSYPHNTAWRKMIGAFVPRHDSWRPSSGMTHFWTVPYSMRSRWTLLFWPAWSPWKLLIFLVETGYSVNY